MIKIIKIKSKICFLVKRLNHSAAINSISVEKCSYAWHAREKKCQRNWLVGCASWPLGGNLTERKHTIIWSGVNKLHSKRIMNFSGDGENNQSPKSNKIERPNVYVKWHLLRCWLIELLDFYFNCIWSAAITRFSFWVSHVNYAQTYIEHRVRPCRVSIQTDRVYIISFRR